MLKVPSLEVLCTSDDAGLYVAANRSGSEVFVMGHGEYAPDTLKNEFLRDQSRGINPKIPQNYFPSDDVTKPPLVSWRAHGSLLYTNWLNYYVYQETPYNLDELARP